MNDYNFGNFVCMLREKKRMTQADIANKLNVTPAAVSKWENGSSKPRVEVLFQLAELLEVRPEELMAGHYIENEHLNSETVKIINERYNYLRKVDTHNNAVTKFKRLIAALIDWNIVGFSAIIVLSMFTIIYQKFISENNQIVLFALTIILLMFPVGVILRDFIFAGRSLGKRIMGLVVLDKATGKPAKISKRIIRNIFLPICQIDTIIMLTTGSSLGDRCAHTVVISKKELNSNYNNRESEISKINSYNAPKPSNIKAIIAIIIVAIVLISALILAITLSSLSTAKDTEEYKICYEYLISSEEFKKTGADETDIKMNRYSLTSYTVKDCEAVSHTAEIEFTVGFFRSFSVICHKENGEWAVCEDCTNFD